MANSRYVTDARKGGILINADDMKNDVYGYLDMAHRPIASMQIIVSANTDAVGVIYVQVSNDNTNWHNYVFRDGTESITVASGTTYTEFREINSAARYLRVFYDSTSATDGGTLTVTAATKRHG